MEIRNSSNGSGSAKYDRCSVSKGSICGSADEAVQKELNRISHLKSFSVGETVVREGEEGGGIGVVVTGVLRVLKTMSDGRQQIVGLLLPSDMFGRVFSTSSRFAIEAATDVTLCSFERRGFERLVEQNRELEHRLLLSVLDELDAARDWMVLLGCQNALERVGSFLIFLQLRSEPGKGGQSSSPPCISIPVSRRDFAAYLGTTVETISRTIQYMARKSVIEIVDPQHFIVLNWNRLIKMSGRDDFLDRSGELGQQLVMPTGAVAHRWRSEAPITAQSKSGFPNSTDASAEMVPATRMSQETGKVRKTAGNGVSR